MRTNSFVCTVCRYADGGDMSPPYKAVSLCKCSRKNADGISGEVNLRLVRSFCDIDKQCAALALDADLFAADDSPQRQCRDRCARTRSAGEGKILNAALKGQKPHRIFTDPLI